MSPPSKTLAEKEHQILGPVKMAIAMGFLGDLSDEESVIFQLFFRSEDRAGHDVDCASLEAEDKKAFNSLDLKVRRFAKLLELDLETEDYYPEVRRILCLLPEGLLPGGRLAAAQVLEESAPSIPAPASAAKPESKPASTISEPRTIGAGVVRDARTRVKKL